MRLAWKSVITFSFVLIALSFWVAACGPTNGLPALTGEYVYVSNQGDGTISEFSKNTSTGLLTNDAIIVQPSSTSGPYPDGAFPAISGSGRQLKAPHSSNEFVSVPDSASNDLVTEYTADGPQSGQLFPPGFAPASAGTSPFDVAFDPNGDYLYATNASGVSSFSVDRHYGQLASIGNVTVNTLRGIAAALSVCLTGIVAVVDGAPNPGGSRF